MHVVCDFYEKFFWTCGGLTIKDVNVYFITFNYTTSNLQST